MIDKIERNFPKTISSVFAPLYQRVIAFIIDVMIIYGTAIFFALGFGAINDRGLIMLFAAFVSWIYLTFFYYKGEGQTVGCKIFGIKVVLIDGSKLGFWRALGRSVLISGIISPLGIIIILPLSFILFSILSLNLKPTKQRRQTFWDAATKTCVIKGGVKLKWTEW